MNAAEEELMESGKMNDDLYTLKIYKCNLF